MAIRIIEIMRLGSSFGGLRFALNADKFRVKNENTYSELEKILKTVLDIMSVTPAEEWPNVLSDEKIKNILPDIGTNRGNLDFVMPTDETNDQIVIARCSITFSKWPLGSWVVYDGFRITSNGLVEKLNNGILNKWW